ncbi:hemerythrin HHE cation binding domain-containing protein [Metarhizium album ARSEF 1941]|uniref:Hemerythrin HHE cation binding domain-containing protein n=1 Tax=Metarhizium album (strain ARSEF 1941) TaxID=1081103 RepID=A0A0B2WIV2_METAS|nr:hemerythrin HHE cation binding domain-containing protein [Metarhizium album ARSEF 1941]KHN95981.1 hemerythrin HHE cation binding domain-containing protein [Metarhizium album ARSEF 1941]
MWSAGFTAVVFYAFLGANLFSRRSPFFHDTGAPPAGEWADGPLKLVDTPWTLRQKDDLFTTAATHMALLHNALIRGYNSIYLQAPHVRAGDVSDFAAYALTWHKFLVSHHDDEEARLFPDVVEILRDDGVWANTKQEHGSLLPGLAAFQALLNGTDAATYDASALRGVMDSFAADLSAHLHNEVAVMADMSAHENAPARQSLRGALAGDMLRAWGKSTVTKAGYVDVVPFFLLNTDRTFEGGVWRNWPRIPAVVRWSLVNLVGMRHGPRWRFSSCDAAGRPRELFAPRALREAKGKEEAEKADL